MLGHMFNDVIRAPLTGYPTMQAQGTVRFTVYANVMCQACIKEGMKNLRASDSAHIR